MNTKIWKTLAFLLDYKSKNVKSDDMWYNRTSFLINSLIADSYDGFDLSLDGIIDFAKKNENSKNIINYLNSLPGCPSDIFNFTNENGVNDIFYQNHGFLVMVVYELTICINSMKETSDGYNFFYLHSIDYSKDQLIVSKNNISLFFCIDSKSNILFSHYIEDGIQNNLNIIFDSKDLFINYLKICDSTPLDKDIIKMIYY